MARTLALALALVATDAFIPGTTLRQRVAPVRMVADYLSTMSPSATGTKPKGDYLSSARTTAWRRGWAKKSVHGEHCPRPSEAVEVEHEVGPVVGQAVVTPVVPVEASLPAAIVRPGP